MTDVIVIGGGVIGLSIARELSSFGKETIVLEKNERAGDVTSSRNSGVIHAGIYYPENSLKTKFCISGNKLLYEYANHKRINHKRIGKYIIASHKNDIEKLYKIYNQGIKNLVEIDLLSNRKMKEIYPDLKIEEAIFSPNTGIIDVPELITALEGDIQHNGGLISFKTNFIAAEKIDQGFKIIGNDGNSYEIDTRYLVNASGLYSDTISQKIDALGDEHFSSIKYAKGHYFKYNGNHPFTTLVYPLANEFSSGLHVGFDLSDQIRFGPDITWVDQIDFSFDESLKGKFIESIKQYWPQIDSTKLHPDYVGIRPKLQNFNETMKDFSIKGFNDHGVDGLINIQGVESPGVTSCLSIGKHVLNLIKS